MGESTLSSVDVHIKHSGINERLPLQLEPAVTSIEQWFHTECNASMNDLAHTPTADDDRARISLL